MKQPFWQAFSASVIGPAHIEEKLPNQDAVKTKITEQVAIAVVSDGVGSAKQADIGAKSACNALLESVELWINSPSSEIKDLLRLIQTLWLMRIRPHKVTDCAATLLFVLILENKRVVMGQLGDGIILHWNGEVLLHQLFDDKAGFSNETMTLRETGVLSQWKIIDFKLSGDLNSFILLTDGISENIKPTQLAEFAKITDTKIRQVNNDSETNKWLEDELNDWQTPFHRDDKTMAILLQQINKKGKVD